MMVGSGWPPGPKGPKMRAHAITESMMAAAKMAFFPGGVRDEGDTSLFGEGVVLADIGSLVDEAAGHGPVVDAETKDHPDVHTYEREEGAGYDEDVQGKKASEGRPGYDGAAEHHVYQRSADDRDTADD